MYIHTYIHIYIYIYVNDTAEEMCTPYFPPPLNGFCAGALVIVVIEITVVISSNSGIESSNSSN